jgi:hypothetical protein
VASFPNYLQDVRHQIKYQALGLSAIALNSWLNLAPGENRRKWRRSLLPLSFISRAIFPPSNWILRNSSETSPAGPARGNSELFCFLDLLRNPTFSIAASHDWCRARNFLNMITAQQQEFFSTSQFESSGVWRSTAGVTRGLVPRLE